MYHMGREALAKWLIYGGLIVFFCWRPSLSLSQVDNEFWFVVPELSHRGNTGGTPGTLRIATMELPATVTISMPANPFDPVLNPTGFQDIVVNIAGNSTAAVDLTALIDVFGSPVNRLENKPLTATGINNFGLYITATNMITAYWEVNYDFGADLWTLKGSNGLGTLFYTPFQTVYNNRNLIPRTYSAIDIVATEDNTQVTFTLPPGIAASYGFFLTPVPAGGTLVVTLNKGQTFSLFPRNYSILAGDRLAGTRIESTAPIAVTVKDDAIASGSQGQDVVGDQLVPVNIVGDNYIVPEINNPNHVYVLATEDNTNIYVYGVDGLPIGPTPYVTLNAGQQALVTVPGGTKYNRITSRVNPLDPVKPFYVFQMGIENQSRGGALVPAIGCTGNTQLAFTRARADNKFYFYIITERGNEDKFLIDGVRDDGIIDPGAFTEMAGSGGWVVLFTNSINSNILSVGQHLVQNTGGIFHLAILNGFPGASRGRLYFGYYSDFGGLNIGATIAGTNSQVVRACYGDPVQLYAFGGTNYLWTPDTYLDDATSNMPTAINLPPGAHSYNVLVSGACGSDDVDLTVLISSPVIAYFEASVTSGCSPLEVQFDDRSSGTFSWQYDLGDGTPLIRYDLDPVTPYPPPPNYPLPFSINQVYTNTTSAPIEFTVTLLAKNESGCSDIMTKTIVVYPEIHSDFFVDRDNGCEPLPVQFQNNSSGDTATWVWEFGDGGSSLESDPLHVYRNQFGPDNLVFEARLIATSPNLCRDTSSHFITVSPYIDANFAFDTVYECTPHEIWITDQSYGADSYSWDFGDGTTSSSSGPTITKTYVNNTPFPRTYTITLRVDNEEGCSDSISRDVTVFPDINASFIADPVEGCSPFEIVFQNTSGGASSYFWDFGDGGTSTDIHPIHLYEANLLDHDTVYRVTLVATSDELCTDTALFDVIIHPYIEAAFTVEDIIGCDPFTINIENQSIGADLYFWDFGDGSPVSNTSAANFQHTYLNPTNATVEYTLQLAVRNLQGCTDTLVRYISVHPLITASFTADVFEGCHPMTVTFTDQSVNAFNYFWDFGDGASSLLPSPVHVFTNFGTADTTYIVTLTTSTADGECVKTVSWPMLVHPNVEAEFSFSEALGCNPFLVTFENLSLGGLNYTWDFGDGTIISTLDPGPRTHTFVNNDFNIIQDYEVSLLVENAAGCTSEKRRTVRVYPDIQAGFNASVTEGCHPLSVDFTNQSNGALTYVWNFGDGSTSGLQDPSRTFTNTGTVDSIYTVTLIGTASNNQCRDTFSMDITVHPYLNADFTIPDPLGCNPFDVVFENASTNASLYRWDFGDGTNTVTNTMDPFVHRFSNPDFANQRVYEITLVAENFAGCTSEIRRTITVEPDIRAVFSASQTEGCHPLEVDFMNSSDGAAYYLWDFGDGTTSQLVNPSRTFTNTGTVDSTYRVWLLATASNNVCQDSLYLDITVHPYVKADFTFEESINCVPTYTVFHNASVGGETFYWDFGDGSDTITVSAAPFTHRYTNINYTGEQDYEITLVAENFAGCTDETRRTITIEPDIRAQFGASQLSGCHPLEVDFTNLSDGAAYYLWEFGDGTSSSLANPSQTFRNLGSADITYRVWLHVWASNNYCQDSFYLDIVVHPYINADFAFLEGIHCTPSTVQFNNASIGGATFRWDFGDGSDTLTTDLDPVRHVFNNSSYTDNDVYQVRLTAENTAGCTSEITKSLAVYPAIEAAFSLSIDEGCHPLEVDFTNLTNGGYTYSWDFGDGSTSDADAPGHTFTNFTDDPITRQVLLSAVSRFDCHSAVTAEVTIHPRPKARFETDRIIDCPPFDMPIVNTSLNADQYTWVFGDGDTLQTNAMDPMNHIFGNATGDIAIYEMSLRAASNFGCADTSRQKIYVYPGTVADFSFNPAGCSPLSVGFTNGSTRGYSYLWDFGDGTSMTIQDPTNIYFNLSDHDTVYYVNLTSTSVHGCVDSRTDSVFVYAQPEAEFIALPTHQEFPSSTVSLDNMTNPGPWNYLWDMGDGSTSSLEDPQPHTYATWGEYVIDLHVSSAHCADSVWHTIRIFATMPIADFDTVYPGCVPLTVQFTNNSLYGDSYLWEFDDGSTSTEFEPLHTFTEFGIYNVKLTVTGSGGIDYAYHQVEVYRKPIVNFRVAPEEVMLPDQEIKLFNLSEHGETFLWDFGDGNISTEVSPRYLYSALGTYDISLDVWTEYGCTDRLVKPGAVTVLGRGLIMFPNAFKPLLTGPNGGYYTLGEPERNHIFHPYWEGVEEYHLLIYNRWGELVFESNDVNIGWDGYLDGQLASQDVFAWKCWGIFNNGKPFSLVGDVTLLHHDKTK
jgi:PKD repeat protein